MKFDLDFSDRSIIHYFITNSIMSEIEAMVYTIVLTRPIGRDKLNLANLLILYRYPELSDLQQITSAIDSLVQKGLFFEVKHGSSIRIECKDPESILAGIDKGNIDNEEYQRIIKLLRDKQFELQEYLIENIGWANSKYASDTYVQALDGASHSIKLPVFSAATQGRAKEAIRQAIKRGVKVKVLMFSPELALKTHGIGRDKEVEQNSQSWLAMAEELKGELGNFELRFVTEIEYGYLAGALLVDNELFRYDLYYPTLQRGHEGYIIQGRAYQGETANLFKVLDYYFDVAWSNASFPDRWSNIRKSIFEWIVPIIGVFSILIGALVLQGNFNVFSTAQVDYGLFFISLGLFPAFTGIRKLYNWLSSFEIKRRRQ